MGSDVATILGAAIGTAAVLIVALAGILRRIRPWVHMLDDLAGEEARPGVPRRAGVVERITLSEQLLVDQSKAISDLTSDVAGIHEQLETSDATRQKIMQAMWSDRRVWLERLGLDIDAPDIYETFRPKESG